MNAAQWLEQQLTQLGLTESQKAAAQDLAKQMGSNFVPVSDFHSQLDKQRNTLQRQIDELQGYNTQWQERYETEWAPRLTAIERLESAGIDVNGFSNDGNGGVMNQHGQSFGAADIEEIIQQRLQQFAQTTLDPIRASMADYATFVADKAPEYKEQYGKRFDAQAFRQFAYDNRSQYGNLTSAYEAFTAADRAEADKAAREKWEKDTEERLRRELSSQYQIPEAAAEANGSPFFGLHDNSSAAPGGPTRQQNRQEFAKAFDGKDLKINI